MTATETKTQEPDVNGLSTHIATIIERGGCLFFCLSACACAPRSVAKGDDGANLLLLFFICDVAVERLVGPGLAACTPVSRPWTQHQGREALR